MEELPSFDFTARLEKESGGLASHYIRVPQDVANAFLDRKIKRLIGTIQDVKFNLALISDGQGGRRLSIGNPLRKSAKVVEGSTVRIHVEPDPDPNHIELCEEFEAVLDLDEEAGKVFYGFTKGRQRSLAYYANGAKQVETRIKRALDLAKRLKEGTLSVQNTKKNSEKGGDRED